MDNPSLPDYVHFNGLQLLYSKSGPFSMDRSDLGMCITEATEVLSEHAPIVKIVIPTSNEKYIDIIDESEGCVLFQFFRIQVLCAAKGASDNTNRCVLIGHSEDGPTYTTDTSTCESADILSTDEASASAESSSTLSTPQTRSKLSNIYVVRCRTTYEASRLMYFMGELLCARNGRSTNPLSPDHGVVKIRLITDIQELDEKSGEIEWRSVPKANTQVFKLRSKTKKRFLVGFHQTSGLAQVSFSKCLRISAAYGRYVDESELFYLGNGENQVLDEAANTLLAGSTYATHVPWPSGDCEYFRMFDELSGKDGCIFFTVSVDLALSNVEKPVHLYQICQARVFKSDESFWMMPDRKPVTQDYTIYLTEFMDEERNLYIGRFLQADKVIPPTPVGSLETSSLPVEKNGAGEVIGDQAIQQDEEVENEQEEEPLMSGHGEVSREVLDDDLLKEWGLLIPSWHAKVREQMQSTPTHNFPSSTEREEHLLSGTIGPSLSQLGVALNQHIRRLISRGVPDALRTEVWQLLTAAVPKEAGLLDAYRVLITKPCKFEDVIQRDLARTFPAHAFFRDSVGQDYLFQVSRAYALYDQEVGYCQSLSFFAAVLLLHMPVEQAFTLMVQINNNYGVRELFVDEFSGLHMRLYQLERIIQDQLPDVAKHFSDLGLETHMYASQWFLTLFTAKFPLPLVFHIVDLFLTEGMIFIFKVAFSFIRMARRNLLGLDFEGVLKYLRITLPKRFIDSQTGGELLTAAVSAKITRSKLLKYANEWMRMKAQLQSANSPEQQVKQLRARINRLEQENEALASAFLSSKTSLHHKVEKLEDKAEVLVRELFAARQDLNDALEEKTHLESEISQVKQMLRTSLEQTSDERTKHQSQIAAYQAITTDLVKRTDAITASSLPSTTVSPVDSTEDGTETHLFYIRLLYAVLKQLPNCQDCRSVLDEHVGDWRQEYTGITAEFDESGNDNSSSDCNLTKSDSNELPQVLMEQTVNSQSPYNASFDFKKLMSKQWLSNTLNSLKSLKLHDTHSQAAQSPKLSVSHTPARPTNANGYS